MGWIIAIVYGCMIFSKHKGKGLLIIAICLYIFDSIKALYTANIIVVIFGFLGCIGTYLFEWNTLFVGGMCLGFGFSAIYTLKIKQLNKDETKPISLNESNDEQTKQDTIELSKDVKYSKIEMKNVHDAMEWDNIDRQQS